MERLEPLFRAIAGQGLSPDTTTRATSTPTRWRGWSSTRTSVGHLIGQQDALRGIFNKDIEVRLRPGYFFVEPGFVRRAALLHGRCSVCKKTTWIELLPLRLVHPNVLKAGGLDPEEGGFAFGLALASSCCATASTTSATSSAATCVSSPSSDPTLAQAHIDPCSSR